MKMPPFCSATCATSRRGLSSLFKLMALLYFVILPVSRGMAQSLPDLIPFNFTFAESKTLPGTSSTCAGTIADTDKIQNLALVALFYQNGCYTNGMYNHNLYQVDRGTVGGFPAYKVYEPQQKATNFLASKHAIYYRFPTVENYSVYTFTGGALAKLVDVPAASIPNTTTFVSVPNTTTPVTVSEILGSVTYVFVPSATRVSSYTLLAPGVEGARVKATPFGNVLKYRYTITGTPFDSAVDYTAGPGEAPNIYSNPRRFFLVRNGASGMGAVWQNQADSSLKLTWFGANGTSPSTVALPNASSQGLAAAAGDDAGNVYYLTIQTGDGSPNADRAVTLTKAGPTGSVIATSTPDASTAGLNMVSFFNIPSMASLKYHNGKLALMLGRTMHQSSDGLNHQSAIAVIFNGTTLAVENNLGQTSSHSWENVLTTNANGDFVGVDLGDNFPRGLNLHKLTTPNKVTRLLSGYKTAHGTSPQSPAGATYPVYTAISGGGTTYYQWSNDNKTYTELGGLAQTSLGYAVSFAGERSPGGRLLDNSRVGGLLNDPRNVGFITAVEAFQNVPNTGAEVSDSLIATTGLAETGGFYSFTGGWTPQRNTGVVWLTNYANVSQNASRVKMTTRADGTLLLMWELWNATDYVTTKAMTINPNGTVLNAETDLGVNVRLGRREDPYKLDSSIYFISGNKADPALEVTVVTPSVPLPTLSVVKSGTNAIVSWKSETGYSYQLQSSLTLQAPWTNVGTAVTGDGNTKTQTVAIGAGKKFFHLVVQTP